MNIIPMLLVIVNGGGFIQLLKSIKKAWILKDQSSTFSKARLLIANIIFKEYDLKKPQSTRQIVPLKN